LTFGASRPTGDADSGISALELQQNGKN